ncbi:MAG: hypothetical protein WBF32_09085 [Candidatus Aminicenantaceae bacterium]
MKSKIWSILVVFILVLIVCSDGKNVQSDVAKMNFSGPGVDWLLTKVPEPYTLDELEKIFEERNLKLSNYFLEGNFEEIGNYYGPLGWIELPGNAGIVSGSEQIALFFKNLKETAQFTRDVRSVTFRSEVLEIGVNEHLYSHPSQKNPELDPVYPITERIKIIYDIQNNSRVELESSTTYLHSRKTFK